LRRHSGILLAAFFGVFASFASVFIFTFGVFLKPLSEEFGWSRAQVSGGFALAALTVAFASPFLGRLVDRFGSRAVILPSATLFAVLFASLSRLTDSLVHFYGVLFLLGLVGNGTTQLGYSRAVVQAFDANRGFALAVMLTGSGLGSIVMPSLAQAGIEAWGWRATYQALGALSFLLVIPLTAWLIPGGGDWSGRPRPRGLPPAVQTRLFWLLLAAFFLMSLAVNAPLAHLAALLTDRGVSPRMAAFAASALGGATMAGRLLAGWLVDRRPAPMVAALLFFASAAGLLGLELSAHAAWAFLWAALIGFGMGAEADVIPYFLSRYFSLETFTELYGISFTAFALAGAAGPLIMGQAFDRLGSYDYVLGFLAGCALLAAILIVQVPAKPPHHGEALRALVPEPPATSAT